MVTISGSGAYNKVEQGFRRGRTAAASPCGYRPLPSWSLTERRCMETGRDVDEKKKRMAELHLRKAVLQAGVEPEADVPETLA